jgi:hypothetical protein
MSRGRKKGGFSIRCEICNTNPATQVIHAYLRSSGTTPRQQATSEGIPICDTCFQTPGRMLKSRLWRCVDGAHAKVAEGLASVKA